jgi:CRISPR-associated protein Csm2
MMQQQKGPTISYPSPQDLRTIITDPNGVQKLVEWAEQLGKYLKEIGLTTSQIRALFGEIRQIQAEWGTNPQRAFRRLVLLKPKMAYRARKERGKAVGELVKVLDPALDYVIKAEPKDQEKNFQHFVEFLEAILAYHKAYGGE